MPHLLFIILCFLLSACSEGIVPEDEAAAKGTLSVCIQTSAPIHRTTLQTSDPVQHVEYVQLYVFKGVDDDAVCLQSINVDWQQPVGSTAQQIYQLDPKLFDFDGKTTYTFLAVGLDNRPEETTEGAGLAYHLPDDIQPGSTLGQAYARLADGKVAHDMAHAELFAGVAQSTPSKKKSNLVNIDLYRRVAGVQAYLTDIPEGVTDIQLVLYGDQHSEVPLCRRADASDGTFLDYGTARLTDSSTLLDLPVTKGTLVGVSVSGTTLVKQQGSVLDGAYVLPVEAPTATGLSTLQLKLYKNAELYKTYRVALDDGTNKVYAFPLRANCFYTIGVLNQSENEPQSLGEATSDITIEVEPNFEKDHEYVIM